MRDEYIKYFPTNHWVTLLWKYKLPSRFIFFYYWEREEKNTLHEKLVGKYLVETMEEVRLIRNETKVGNEGIYADGSTLNA